MPFYESLGALFDWLEQQVSLWQGCKMQCGSESNPIHHQFDGRRFACASITSVVVVRKAPVTAIMAMRWTVVSLHATPAEPLDLPELSLWTGVNQMSTTYVKLGMATT